MITKLNLYKKPEYLLLVASLVFFLPFAFFPTDENIFQDIKMFSVPVKTTFWIIPFYHIFLWLLYLLTKKFLYSITITRIHTVIIVLVTSLILIVLFFGINSSQRITEIKKIENITDPANAHRTLNFGFMLFQGNQ